MMKKGIGIRQFAGFIFVSAFGTFLHFLYDMTDSAAAALFSCVNESTWEHMKLLFFPMLLFAVIENFFIGKEYGGFWCIKLKGTLLGLLLIPVLFYTLNGVFGKTPDYINIGIFFVSAAIAFIYETRQFKKDAPSKYPRLAIAVFLLITISFWIFTFIPPEIPLFKDPISGTFGI